MQFNSLPSAAFYAEFERRGVRGFDIGGRAWAYQFGGRGPRVAVISGLHGDEPAGPLALLSLATIFRQFNVLCCPLVNTSGWDRGTRECDGVDLNRCFPDGHPTVARLAAELQAFRPALFLDLHEDSTSARHFVYRPEQRPGLATFLAQTLECPAVDWWFERRTRLDWHGTSEAFAVQLGAEACTVETSPRAEARVDFHRRAVLAALRYIS